MDEMLKRHNKELRAEVGILRDEKKALTHKLWMATAELKSVEAANASLRESITSISPPPPKAEHGLAEELCEILYPGGDGDHEWDNDTLDRIGECMERRKLKPE